MNMLMNTFQSDNPMLLPWQSYLPSKPPTFTEIVSAALPQHMLLLISQQLSTLSLSVSRRKIGTLPQRRPGLVGWSFLPTAKAPSRSKTGRRLQTRWMISRLFLLWCEPTNLLEYFFLNHTFAPVALILTKKSSDSRRMRSLISRSFYILFLNYLMPILPNSKSTKTFITNSRANYTVVLSATVHSLWKKLLNLSASQSNLQCLAQNCVSETP